MLGFYTDSPYISMDYFFLNKLVIKKKTLTIN